MEVPRRDATAPFQTEALDYRIDRTGSVHIPFTFRNTAGDTLFIDHCGLLAPRFVLEALEGGQWVPGLRPLCRDILVPAIRVAPNEIYSDTLRVISAITPTGSPTFTTDLPGIYRFRASVFASLVFRGIPVDSLPLPDRVSNPFRLSREP